MDKLKTRSKIVAEIVKRSIFSDNKMSKKYDDEDLFDYDKDVSTKPNISNPCFKKSVSKEVTEKPVEIEPKEKAVDKKAERPEPER